MENSIPIQEILSPKELDSILTASFFSTFSREKDIFTPQKLEEILRGENIEYTAKRQKVCDNIEFVAVRNLKTFNQYSFSRHSSEINGQPSLTDPMGLRSPGVLHLWNQLMEVGHVVEEKSS